MSTIRKRCHGFRLALLAATSFVCLCASTVQAQTSQQPSPGPEHKKLEARVGKWKYQGEAKASPFGPAGKFAGAETGRMVLNGFFLEQRWEDKSETGNVLQGIVLTGYDQAKKSFVDYQFESDGQTESGLIKIEGNTWTATGNRSDRMGKNHKTKWSSTVSQDGKKRTSKVEYSTDDGKTWLTYFESTATKVSD
jgi:hypothetical protein